MDEAIAVVDPNVLEVFPLTFTVSSAAPAYALSEQIRLTSALITMSRLR